jgi:hypothetical protein
MTRQSGQCPRSSLPNGGEVFNPIGDILYNTTCDEPRLYSNQAKPNSMLASVD